MNKSARGAKSVDTQLAIENTRLKQQRQHACELNEGKWKTMHELEEKVKTQEDFGRAKKLLQSQYDNLFERFQGQKMDWAAKFAIFGGVETE